MINYAKVLELGLKHEPIENPEEYAWAQVDDEAICGAKLNGREANVPDFETEFNLMAVDFAETIRAKFGEKTSVLVLVAKEQGEGSESEAYSMHTGNSILLGQGLSAILERDRTLKMAFSLTALKGLF